MKLLAYNAVHAGLARRTMRANSGALPRRTHSREPSGAQARTGERCLRHGVVDSEHWGTMAYAAPVLSQLQDGPSPISAMVRPLGANFLCFIQLASITMLLKRC